MISSSKHLIRLIFVVSGRGGLWSSSNNNVVSINATTGVALTVSSGTATIYYKIPEVYSAQTEVKVESLTFARVQLDDSDLIITNLPLKGGRGYVVPIVFGNNMVSSADYSSINVKEGIVLYEELGTEAQVPLRCLLSFRREALGFLSAADLFDVKPGLRSGKPVCYVIPKSSSADTMLIASRSEAPLNLLVKIYDEIQAQEVSSDSFVLPFIPAFVVSEAKVELSNSRKKKRLVVTGTQRQLDSLVVKTL